jgi:serpin B
MRTFGIAILALSVSGGLGCGSEAEPTPAQEAGHETVRSKLERDRSPDVPGADMETLIEGNHALALDLFHQLDENAENLLVSPLSIRLAFALLQAGARGETALEIAEVLHFGLEGEQLHAAFNALDLALEARNDPGDKEHDPIELHVANAFWGQSGYAWKAEYLDTIAVNYGAGVETLDFAGAPEASRETINLWVEEKTRDRILDLLPEGSIRPDTVAVLTNALYFKAPWAVPFPQGSARPASFTRLDASKVQADMMTNTDVFGYVAGEGFEAVELNFRRDELGMVFILPDDGAFEAFEEALDTARLGQILDGLESKQGGVAIPKFEFEDEFRLSEALRGLGMVSAFESADLSGMIEGHDLFIDEVYHKTFIAVDEHGAEAAAATAIVVGETSVPVEDFEFRADRPFLFLIRDRVNGAILFFGRVTDPTV